MVATFHFAADDWPKHSGAKIADNNSINALFMTTSI